MMGGDFFIVVFSGISALSNIVIAWKTAKSNDKDLSIEEINRINQESVDYFVLNSDSIPNELRTIIDPETQDIIWGNI